MLATKKKKKKKPAGVEWESFSMTTETSKKWIIKKKH